MVHYCDTYGDNEYIECLNDPLTEQQRGDFCSSSAPTLESLCPWISSDSDGSGGGINHCLVFADHPLYPSVGSMMAATTTLPAGKTWANKKFYYMPYTLAALGHILIMASASDTLLTNDGSPDSFTRLDTENFNTFGPVGTSLSSPVLAVFGTNTEPLEDMCTPTGPQSDALLSVLRWRSPHNLSHGHYSNYVDYASKRLRAYDSLISPL